MSAAINELVITPEFVTNIIAVDLADETTFTTADKAKLNGIEAGAQVNTVTRVAGKTGVVDLNAGDIAYDASETYASGKIGAALKSAEEKLDTIEEGAEVNAVNSVNSKSGDVVLNAGDIGYDGSTVYDTGTVGKELTHLNRQISDDITPSLNQLTENLDNLEDIFLRSFQYLNKDNAETSKYYRAANSIATTTDAGYAIYPEITLPAGTYYFNRINKDFTYGSNSSNSSFKPFSSYAGIITFEEETKLYITAQYRFEADNTMLSDNILPTNYVYGEYNIRLPLSGLQLPQIKFVDASGNGVYTNIQDAINDCKDLDQYNVQTGIHETIIVFPGVYPRFSMGTGGNNVIARRNISIIGLDRQKCIIRDDTGLYKNPPAELRTDGTIANLTFIATHDSGDAATTESKNQYAVHLDYGYCIETFENCTFISYCNAAVGIGLYANEELTFRNCKFISYADSSVWGGTSPYGLYCHTNTTNGTLNQNLTLIDCECVAENSPYGGAFQVIRSTGDSTQYLKLIRNLFYGNNGFGVNIQNGWDTSMSYGNSVSILP